LTRKALSNSFAALSGPGLIRAIGFFRTAFYLPTVTATVAIATIWLWIFNPGSGLANGVLSLFGFAPGGWLSDPNTALPSLMIVGIWQGLGTKMIIYLAALQGVSRDLLEAAGLDGAIFAQNPAEVQWPYLMAGTAPATLPMIVMFVFAQKRFVEGMVNVGLKG